MFRHKTQHFATEKEIQQYRKKYVTDKKDQILLSNNFFRPAKTDIPITGNDNITVIGKERASDESIIYPNLSQINASYVILDPEKKYLSRYRQIFTENGYKIKVLDLTNFQESHRYDPWNYCSNTGMDEISQPPIAEFKNISSLYNIMQEDEMNFENFDEEKTTLFIIPDTDDYCFVPSLAINQILSTLYRKKEERRGSVRKKDTSIPVTVILNGLEKISAIENLDMRTATSRLYNISFMIHVCDINQLKEKYSDWRTIVGNCSTVCFLGMMSPSSRDLLKEFSIRFNEDVPEQKILIISNYMKKPVLDDRLRYI